jgi:hypothetical protein
MLEEQNGASVETDKIFTEKLTILVYNMLLCLAMFLYESAFRIYKCKNKYLCMYIYIYIQIWHVFMYIVMYYAGNIFMTSMRLVPFI